MHAVHDHVAPTQTLILASTLTLATNPNRWNAGPSQGS